MFNVVLAGPRLALHLTRRIFAAGLGAAEAVPRIAAALDEMRATLRQLERLLAYVAEEVPELAYQVEQIRARLDAEPETDRPEPAAPATARRG
ncbi:hypothetical protein OG943_15815 [Amycolatopsis sp. NBC_00345]|uniref:hypothetical protein n=1 Tax=Amycolatopsis sp. NBC_00345 TaxID=2975955 RepID=UPI002E266886